LFWFELAVGKDLASKQSASAFSLPDEAWRGEAWREGEPGALDAPQFDAPVWMDAPEPLDPIALASRFAIVALARGGEQDSRARARDAAARLRELAAAPAVPESAASTGSDRIGKNARPVTRRGEGAGAPLRILLAEDNGVNRMVLDKILTRAGHATTVVADGEAALHAMLDHVFDVILMDVNMPRIDGLEAARLYKFALPPETRAPIIALTADAGRACREDCAEAGMVACLTKPLAPDTLLAAIAAAVRQTSRAENTAETDEFSGRTAGANAPPPDEAGKVLRPASLDALTALGGEAFLHDVVRQFIGEGTQAVERMTIAIEQGDLCAVQYEAHALASSAGNIGAVDLARLCSSWRDVGPERIAIDGDDFSNDLRGEWSRAALALGVILAKDQVSRGPGTMPRQGDAAA
jgi:two-component system sensor histidine kinase RpfC